MSNGLKLKNEMDRRNKRNVMKIDSPEFYKKARISFGLFSIAFVMIFLIRVNDITPVKMIDYIYEGELIYDTFFFYSSIWILIFAIAGNLIVLFKLASGVATSN